MGAAHNQCSSLLHESLNAGYAATTSTLSRTTTITRYYFQGTRRQAWSSLTELDPGSSPLPATTPQATTPPRLVITCERGEGVQGVLTLFCSGAAQVCHDDRVVELKEQLEDGDRQEEEVEVEREKRVEDNAPWMEWR